SESGGTKNRHAGDPESDSRLRRDQKCGSHAQERNDRGPKREKIQGGERHFARTDLQREKIIPESRLRRSRKHKKNHERAVQQRERGVALRRAAEYGKERNVHTRRNQMDTHDQRHRHSQKNAEQRQPQIPQPDGFVIGGEQTARGKAALRRIRLVRSAVVSDHARLSSPVAPKESGLGGE